MNTTSARTFEAEYSLDLQAVDNLLFQVVNDLRSSEDPAERGLGSELNLVRFALNDQGAFAVGSALGYIGHATTGRGHLRKQTIFFEQNQDKMFYTAIPPEMADWGKQFLKEILREIRKAVCTDKPMDSEAADSRSYPKAIAVAISSTVMNACGVDSAMALGIATLVLLTISRATKQAFCTMTDDNVLAAIEQNIQKERASSEGA